MKFRIISLLFLLSFILCSCTVQEKMNPYIFAERFSSLMKEEITIDESFNDKARFIFFFSDKNGENYVCELLTDSSDNIKKLCLTAEGNGKTESFKYIFEKIVKIYAPSENTEEIISVLFDGKWNYHITQWYRYSSVISKNNIFASIENIKHSTESDAELTLNQSDIIYPQ